MLLRITCTCSPGPDLRWQSGPALPGSSVPLGVGGECAGVMGGGVRGDGGR